MKQLNPALSLFLLLILLVQGIPVELHGRQSAEQDISQQYAEEGRNLFTGKTRFANSGPSCISCHHTNDTQQMMGGGTYARELTTFYGRSGEDVTRIMIENIPFPEMRTAYGNHQITEGEVDKLIAYLAYISEQGTAGQQPFSTGAHFLWSGLVGLGIILISLWLLWRHRKRGSVNDPIYRRQIQSV